MCIFLNYGFPWVYFGSYGSNIFRFFCLFFKEMSMLFSMVVVPFYILTSSVGGSLFSTPSLAFTVCRFFFDDGHSDWCEVIPHGKLRSWYLDPSFHGKSMGKQWKQWEILFWGAPKSLQMMTAAIKLKDDCSLEEKL